MAGRFLTKFQKTAAIIANMIGFTGVNRGRVERFSLFYPCTGLHTKLNINNTIEYSTVIPHSIKRELKNLAKIFRPVLGGLNPLGKEHLCLFIISFFKLSHSSSVLLHVSFFSHLEQSISQLLTIRSLTGWGISSQLSNPQILRFLYIPRFFSISRILKLLFPIKKVTLFVHDSKNINIIIAMKLQRIT